MALEPRRPIGVFDSGIGGLTVLKALREALPAQSFIYLGDTARLPYGTKSGETIIRYALQAASRLVAEDIGLLVVACNTASAYALPALQERFPDIPVIGVIQPGAEAAVRASASGRIAVLCTEGTTRAAVYDRTIVAISSNARVTSLPCQLLVSLAEEGWTTGDIAQAAATRYLAPLFTDPATVPDTIVLGCTHFPLLRQAIETACPVPVTIIDSGVATARFVAGMVNKNNDARIHLSSGERSAIPQGWTGEGLDATTGLAPHPPVFDGRPLPQGEVNTRFLATDSRERFARVAGYFLDQPITPEMVELVDLTPSLP